MHSKKQCSRDSLRQLRREFDVKALALPHFSILPNFLAQKGYVCFQGGKWWEFNYQNGGFTHGLTKGLSDQGLPNAGWFLKHMGGDGMDLARVTNQPVYDFLAERAGQAFSIWYAPSLGPQIIQTLVTPSGTKIRVSGGISPYGKRKLFSNLPCPLKSRIHNLFGTSTSN